jgi:hypothetical protein
MFQCHGKADAYCTQRSSIVAWYRTDNINTTLALNFRQQHKFAVTRNSPVRFTMITRLTCIVLVAFLQQSAVRGFTTTAATSALFRRQTAAYDNNPFSSTLLSIATTASGDEAEVTTSPSSASAVTAAIKQQRKQLVRQEGGRFAFDTKFGALNPFAIYYGLVAIVLGIPWIVALTFCKFLYFVTRDKFDTQVRYQPCVLHWNTTCILVSGLLRKRRLPVFLSHVWGVALMRLTGCYPKIVNKEILTDYFKK